MCGEGNDQNFSIFVKSLRIVMQEHSVNTKALPTQGLPPELSAGHALGKNIQ